MFVNDTTLNLNAISLWIMIILIFLLEVCSAITATDFLSVGLGKELKGWSFSDKQVIISMDLTVVYLPRVMFKRNVGKRRRRLHEFR